MRVRMSDAEWACELHGLTLSGRERALLAPPFGQELLSQAGRQERYALRRPPEPCSARCAAA